MVSVATTTTAVAAVSDCACMEVKRLTPTAKLPARGSAGAAGFDLSAAEAAVVPTGGKAMVKTGLSIAIPAGTYARIAPRSGLAAKFGINVGAGVVDYDYRGEVCVVLFNHGDEDFTVTAGDRIAQVILEKLSMVDCEEVESLDETTRGAGGFGSTGVAEAVTSSFPAKESPAPLAEATPAAAEGQLASDGAEVMRVKKLRESAVLPVRGSVDAAGFDLAAAEEATVPPGGKAIVKTGLAIAIPEGTYARIAPRSGLAAKRMINVGAGVVDFDYRGEVGVVLFNHGSEEFSIAVGDRIAQLVLEQVDMAGCVEVQSLDETARGEGGFGSTGVANGDGPADAAPAAAVPQPTASEADAMLVHRRCPSAVMPTRGSAHAAGFDLAASEATKVPAGGKAVVKTGLSIAIPKGTYARVAPRSGLAAKKMIHSGAGVVDYDYRGEVCVVLFNHGAEDFAVEVGDRIAQLILERIAASVSCVEVEALSGTKRGAGGFGSTGVSKDSVEKRLRVD